MKILALIPLFVLLSGIIGHMQIEGVVSVKGNAPHSYLAVTTIDNKEYAIVGKYKKKIWEKYQNQTVILKGRIVKKAAGPGMPAEFEVTKIIIRNK